MVAGRSRGVVAAAGAGGGAALFAALGLAADEGEVLEDDAEARTFLAGLLIFPLVELEAAFHEDAGPLAAVLGDDLGLLAVALDVDVGDFLALLAFLGRVGAVDGEGELGEGLAGRKGAGLRSRVILPARITRLKEEATARRGRGLLGHLHEQAVDGAVQTKLLAEGRRGGDRSLEVELDVEAGGELAVDDA